MSQESTRRDLLRIGAGAMTAGLTGFSGLSGQRTGAIAGQLAAETKNHPQLKITGVTSYLLRHKLKQPFGASVSVPLSTLRETLLVKIETDSGLVGWGETAPISGSRGTIDTQLKPKLLGRNPLEYRKLWRELWGPNFGNAMAVGAVETALNDIRGKALGLPVADLFGGRMRDSVPVYVSALAYVQGRPIEEEYPEIAAQMVEQGHRAIKMRLGRHPVKREAKVAAKVREVVGPDVKLLADGNGAYTLGSALQMAHELHDLGFEFFEEPLPQSPRYAGYEELRRRVPLPLAAGEVLDSRIMAKELIDRRAMHIIQPDLSLCGGLGEALFIAELAAMSGIGCVPHCWGGDILIAATTQLLSLLPDPHWGLPTDTPMLELDQSENPWRGGLATTPLALKDGSITVSTKPGLGIEIDEEAVRRYAV